MKTRRTIYKYPVKLDDTFMVHLPVDAEVLSVQAQNGEPFMWVLHTAETTRILPFTFRLMGTGHILEGENWKYIGTFQQNLEDIKTSSRVNFVWHLFLEVPHAIPRREVLADAKRIDHCGAVEDGCFFLVDGRCRCQDDCCKPRPT